MASVKTMQQLLNEIDQAKLDVENNLKTLEQIDTGHKKANTNRDRAVEGRIQIKNLTERIIDLRNQLNLMTEKSDPTVPTKTFDKTKQNALKTLSNLFNRLHQVDKQLEKVTGNIPSSTDVNAPSVIAPTVSTENENTKGIRGFIRKLSLGNKKKPTSSTTTIRRTPPSSNSEDETTSDEEETDEEESDIDEKKTDEKKNVITNRTQKVQSSSQFTKKVDSSNDESTDNEDEDDKHGHENVIVNKTQKLESSTQFTKKLDISNNESEDSKAENDEEEVDDNEDDDDQDDDDDNDDDDDDDEEEEEDDDDEDHMNDNHALRNELHNKILLDDHVKYPKNNNHQLRTSTPTDTSKKPPIPKMHLTSSSSPISRKTTTESFSTSISHKKTASSQQRTAIPVQKQSDDETDDSYSDTNADEEDDELTRLHNDSEQETEPLYNYDQAEEDELAIVNERVQELRMGEYSPGTQFCVLYDFKALQTGDLTINKDDILILIEQKPDDWWLFKNLQTQQQGMVPINHVKLQSKISEQGLRRPIKAAASALTLIDVFKKNKDIPSGFTASILGPLTQQYHYKLYNFLKPKMTESNLALADLHWQYNTDQICSQEAYYQKILKIKKCLKLPKITSEQIDVVNRCIRVCLYDGFKIISNIHSIRAKLSGSTNQHDLTEDWSFSKNDQYSFIDEQSQLLIRSDEYDRHKDIYLLIELSLLCKSKISNEECEICCGWTKILFNDDQLSGMTNTKSYNKLLHGGNFDESNIFLNSQYKSYHSHGLSKIIDRYKQARIKFSLESIESSTDTDYDNLPLASMIIPINLVQILVFYRNELAYQLLKRYHEYNLSAKPLHSIFLSTFNQALEQPELIYILQRLYHRQKNLTFQKEKEKFLELYELSVYPLLFYRLLPPYNFHNIEIINERRKLIMNLIKQESGAKINNQLDILAILLDEKLTETWTPFSTDEICFSFRKYNHDFTSKLSIES